MPSDERRRAAARGSSLASRRLSRPAVFALTAQERIPCLPSRPTVSVAPSLRPLLTEPARRRRSIALRPLLTTYGRMSESTRLWWLLIPPGASLVTHAARLTRAPRSSCCAPHSSLSSRQAHDTPTTATPFPSPFLFPSFSFSPAASSVPQRYTARRRRYPWADTGDARAPLHLRSTLRALLSHRLERTMPLLSPSALTSPTALRALALSPHVVARWKDHDCPRLSFTLSQSSRPLLPFLISAVCNRAVVSSEHPRRTSVTPVIVRLLTGMYANDMPGAPRRDGPCARVYSGATRDLGSCRKPPPPDGHVEIGPRRGRHSG